MHKTVLITGASGFVGQFLVHEAISKGFTVRAAARTHQVYPVGVQSCLIAGLDATTDWHDALNACDCVIHLAGRAHVMHEQIRDCLSEYRRINTAATLKLAAQAAKHGVKRFIYVSSVKVNGEASLAGQPFTVDDIPIPADPYAISKWEAEQGLQELAARTGLQVVIVRPPLVYGAGVKANFAALISVLKCGLPLPFAAITDNRRSFVGIDNLCDFLVLCVSHPAAPNQTFFVSDGEDLSTAQLLNRLGTALGHPARLVSVPPWFLERSAKLLGKADIAQRLLGNLQVDIQKNQQLLNWSPPLSVDEAFRCL